MNLKRAVLIAAAAGTIALTGCAARSEYYGVFVADSTDSRTLSEYGEFGNTYGFEETAEIGLYSEITEESAEESNLISTPDAPASAVPPETSAASPVDTEPAPSEEAPQTTSEPQTIPSAPSVPSTKSSVPEAPSTQSATTIQTTPATPVTSSAPSTSATPQTPASAQAPSTVTASSAPAPETTASSKKAETTATVAAAVDEPAPAEDYINEVLRLVNIERAKEGLSPLELDSALSKAAKVRAEEQTELFGHTRPDGQSCFSVFEEYGISYRIAGENAAAGYSTPEDVVNAWMNSEGHRANILKPGFEKLGVGFAYGDDSYGAYWIQLFIGE